MNVRVVLALYLGLITIAAAAPASAAESANADRVTYTRDIAPLLQENCQNCHRPGQIAPMPLMSYEDTRPWAKSIRQQIGTRKMPPYFAHPSSLPMRGDRNLSDEQIAMVIRWVDQGAPRGNPKDLPEPRVFAAYEGGWQLKQPDIVMQPLEPFDVPAAEDDLYQCFSVPLGLDQDLWIKGVEFKPSNSKVVHHFILFEDKLGRFKQFDDATPEPGCECADMEKILVGTSVVKMWAPGNVQPLADEGIGQRIAAGSNFILQVHYHNVTGEPQVDQSLFALHIAQPDETIMKETRMQLVVQPSLNIKAGDPDSHHEATFVTPKDVTLYSTGVHMHYRGKSMGMWAKRPGDTDETTIIWVPHYDFNWQLTYEFEEPWKAPKGTAFTMRSIHNNSPENPFNPDPNVDVHWGLASTDEMAFSGYGYTYDDEALNVTPEIPGDLSGNPAVVEVSYDVPEQTD